MMMMMMMMMMMSMMRITVQTDKCINTLLLTTKMKSIVCIQDERFEV